MSDETPTGNAHSPNDEENSIRVNRPTEVYQETHFPGSHRDGDRLLQEDVEIDGEEWTLGTLVDLERLRRERTAEWSFLLRSLGDETRRTVLVALLRGAGTYDSIQERVGTTRRTVRNHVYALRDAGVVEVGGNPSTVSFRDEEVRLLASDALSFL